MSAPALDRLLDLLRESFSASTLVKATLSAPRAPTADLRRLTLRPVSLRVGRRLSCTWRYGRRDVTKNLPLDDALALVRQALADDFGCAHVFTTEATAQFEVRPGRMPRLRLTSPQHDEPPSLAHDRRKRRVLAPGARSWLEALGVSDSEGRTKRGMEGKLRQIDKFVELLAHHLPPHLRARAGPLRIVDMGAGKGYLTFATAAWLQQEGVAAEVRGIEARSELVDLGNAAAEEHGLSNLRFEVGTIATIPPVAADVVLALHACDTATDDALARAVAAGAQLILASPCCHKEVRPQLRAPAELMSILRHGILRERQAEIVTDALRAALLEAAGYAVDVIEFVASEHSAKNLLLVATRRRDSDHLPEDRRLAQRADAARAAQALARAFDVTQQTLAASLGIGLDA
ncbi:MAG: SAM-dependent methyltransferase [Planctomycetota bacterium]